MMTKGAAFLEASIGSAIRRLCTLGIAIETDPSRSGKNAKQIEKNVDLLVYWCQEFWKSIYDARDKCPESVLTAIHSLHRSAHLSLVTCGSCSPTYARS